MYSKLIYRISALLYLPIFLVSYFFVIKYANEVGFQLEYAVTYFSIMAIHAAWFALIFKGWCKNQEVNNFVSIIGLGMMLATTFLYFTLQWTPDHYAMADENLQGLLFVHDIIVHGIIGVLLLAGMIVEVWETKIKYNWTVLIPIAPFMFWYEWHAGESADKLNGYYPYAFLDPTIIGQDQMWFRYIIILIFVSTLGLIFISSTKDNGGN